MDNFKKLFLWNLLIIIPAGLVSVALPLYLNELNISYTEMGVIFGLGPVLGMIVGYFAGAHSDSIGRRPYIILTSVFATIFFSTLAFSTKVWQFITAEISSNISSALNLSSSSAYLSDITEKKTRGKSIAFFWGVGNVIESIIVITAGYLILFFGYQNLFLFCALLTTLSLFIGFRIGEKIKPKKASFSEILDSLNPDKIEKKVKIFFILETILIITTQALHLFGTPLYFKGLGADIALIGILIGLNSLINAGAYMLSGKIVDKYNPFKIMSVALLAVALMNFAMVFENDLYLAALLFLSQAVFFGILGLAFDKTRMDLAGKNSGRDLAFIGNGTYIGSMFGAILAGVILDGFGFPGIFLFRTISFAVVIAILALFFRKS
jgi:MFS family permease